MYFFVPNSADHRLDDSHDDVKTDEDYRRIKKTRQKIVHDAVYRKMIDVKFVARADNHDCQVDQAKSDLHALESNSPETEVISFCKISRKQCLLKASFVQGGHFGRFQRNLKS